MQSSNAFWEVLKHATSPEAKRHKSEYDTDYETSPDRVKYHTDLKRERRQRGIDGKGGPDMSHTKDHTLVAEDPHTNRARHFKERGTLKMVPVLKKVNAAGNYTKPGMRKKIVARVKAGSKGGKPGQWSARKAQLVAVKYKKAGGGYRD